MLSVKFLGNKRVSLVESPIPVPPPGWVRVKMMASGVCRTDIDLLYEPPVALDITPGHETAGIVDAVNDARHFAPGDRVIVNCHVTCGTCEHCQRGDLIFCPTLTAIGFDHHGGDAEYLLVPEGSLRRLPDDISFELGVLATDALATPYHAVQRAKPNAGEVLGIVGVGPLGLMGVVSAKSLGTTVVAIDTLPERLEQAARFGADHTALATDPNLDHTIAEVTGGRGIDTVIECSGSARAILMAFGLLRNRGTLIQVGVCEQLTLDPNALVTNKEISYIGSRNCNDHELPELYEMIRRFPAIQEIITHRFPLRDAEAAFELADARQGLKILLMG